MSRFLLLYACHAHEALLRRHVVDALGQISALPWPLQEPGT